MCLVPPASTPSRRPLLTWAPPYSTGKTNTTKQKDLKDLGAEHKIQPLQATTGGSCSGVGQEFGIHSNPAEAEGFRAVGAADLSSWLFQAESKPAQNKCLVL